MVTHVQLSRNGVYEKTVQVSNLGPTLIQMVLLSDGTRIQEEYKVLTVYGNYANASFERSFVNGGQLAAEKEKNAKLSARLREHADASWKYWDKVRRLREDLDQVRKERDATQARLVLAHMDVADLKVSVQMWKNEAAKALNKSKAEDTTIVHLMTQLAEQSRRVLKYEAILRTVRSTVASDVI